MVGQSRKRTPSVCLLLLVLSAGCGWKSWEYDDGVYKVHGYCDRKQTYPPRESDYEIPVLSVHPRAAHVVVARIWATWEPESGNEEIADILFLEALDAITGINLRPRYGAASTALSGIRIQARAVGADAIVTVRGTFSRPSCEYYRKDDSGGLDTENCDLRGVVVEAIRFSVGEL